MELEPELDDAIDALQKAEALLSEAACVRTLEGHSGQVHDISTIEVSCLVFSLLASLLLVTTVG